MRLTPFFESWQRWVWERFEKRLSDRARQAIQAREAFQRLKEHFMEKLGVSGELADMGVIITAFQSVKESLG